MSHFCLNYPIKNILSITLVNDTDLVHCADWTDLPYIWKQRYSFPVVGILDEFGVIVVVIVSPKEVELRLFTLGVSNECEV